MDDFLRLVIRGGCSAELKGQSPSTPSHMVCIDEALVAKTSRYLVSSPSFLVPLGARFLSSYSSSFWE